jgi:hypothetical protein
MGGVMWLEKLSSKIDNLSYEGPHPHGQLSNLFKGATGKEFDPPDGYRGAYPLDEPPWEPVDNLKSTPVEILGVDGSQIYPDPAEPLPWAYAHAMTTSPPERYLARFISPGELLRARAASGRKLIDTIRFSLELELASECAREQGSKAVVLLDGPILPPGRISYARDGFGKEILDRALSEMDDAVEKGGIIAGFTPNGHARYMSNLLLAMVGEDNEVRQLPLIDRKLVQSLINKRQRTALFKRVALDRREVVFFYTTQGRVEFPYLPSPEVIQKVWNTVEEGYPVQLAAAHHLAKIPNGTASHLKAVVRANLREESTKKALAKLRS